MLSLDGRLKSSFVINKLHEISDVLEIGFLQKQQAFIDVEEGQVRQIINGLLVVRQLFKRYVAECLSHIRIMPEGMRVFVPDFSTVVDAVNENGELCVETNGRIWYTTKSVRNLDAVHLTSYSEHCLEGRIRSYLRATCTQFIKSSSSSP